MPRRSLTAKELLAFCEGERACRLSREWIASEIRNDGSTPLSAEDLWNKCEHGAWLQWLIYHTGDEMGSSWIECWVAIAADVAAAAGEDYRLKPMAVDIRNNFAFWPIESRIAEQLGINLHEEEKKEVVLSQQNRLTRAQFDQFMSGVSHCLSSRWWMHERPLATPEELWTSCDNGFWLVFMIHESLGDSDRARSSAIEDEIMKDCPGIGCTCEYDCAKKIREAFAFEDIEQAILAKLQKEVTAESHSV